MWARAFACASTMWAREFGCTATMWARRGAPERPKIWLRSLGPANKKVQTTKWLFQVADGLIWTHFFVCRSWAPAMWARAFACARVRLDNVTRAYARASTM